VKGPLNMRGSDKIVNPPAVPPPSVPFFESLPGFYAEAWQRAHDAQLNLETARALLAQMYAPDSDVRRLADISVQSAQLLRVAIERAQTKVLGGTS